MKRQLEAEVKVGIFVSIGVGLVMLAILLLGGTEDLFSHKNHYRAHFPRVDGLIVGAKVILDGVPVGTVEKIQFDKEQRSIQILFSVTRQSADLLRNDSTVEIATQGVLGDKYISINSGTATEPILENGADIPNRPAKDLTQFLNKGDQLMLSLNSIAGSLERILKTFEAEHRSDTFFKNMAETSVNLSEASSKLNQQLDHIALNDTVTQLNQILRKVNEGAGTVGELINDPSLYYELNALIGGANRNRIIRNLVRETIRKSEENPK